MLVLVLIQYKSNYNSVDAALLVEAGDVLAAYHNSNNSNDTRTSATNDSLFGIILLSSVSQSYFVSDSTCDRNANSNCEGQ